MTMEEAEKLAAIIGTADGGCSTCVEDLARRAAIAFPEFRWTPTRGDLVEQPDWSDDPEDRIRVGVVVLVQPV